MMHPGQAALGRPDATVMPAESALVGREAEIAVVEECLEDCKDETGGARDRRRPGDREDDALAGSGPARTWPWEHRPAHPSGRVGGEARLRRADRPARRGRARGPRASARSAARSARGRAPARRGQAGHRGGGWSERGFSRCLSELALEQAFSRWRSTMPSGSTPRPRPRSSSPSGGLATVACWVDRLAVGGHGRPAALRRRSRRGASSTGLDLGPLSVAALPANRGRPARRRLSRGRRSSGSQRHRRATRCAATRDRPASGRRRRRPPRQRRRCRCRTTCRTLVEGRIARLPRLDTRRPAAGLSPRARDRSGSSTSRRSRRPRPRAWSPVAQDGQVEPAPIPSRVGGLPVGARARPGGSSSGARSGDRGGAGGARTPSRARIRRAGRGHRCSRSTRLLDRRVPAGRPTPQQSSRNWQSG